MMKANLLSNPLRLTTAALLASFALASALPAFAITITGVVTNGTTHKPAAGDTVVLIALAQRMQEIAHTKTDSRGHYSISSPDEGMHLIRVDHQGAAYFQPVPPNTPDVDVEIFDVAPAVAGVTTEADVLRVQTDPQGLSVTESLFVKNDSTPPRTQFGNRSYEFYLPPNALLEGSAAMGPGGMPVQSAPVPLADKGHYTFLFPLRPGETQFQLTYHLPYSGSYTFSPRFASNVANFVVILPKSMSFQPGPASSFQTVDATQAGQPAGAQTYLIRDAGRNQPPVFTVSGTGAMPRDTEAEGGQNTGNGSAAEEGSAAGADNRPGIGLGKPIDTPDPLHKYKWWILGGIALVFAAGTGFLLRRPVDSVPASAPAPSETGHKPTPVPTSSSTLLQALKDELFVLETDHVQGRVSDSEYGEIKSALELVLRRALARQPA